MTEEVCMKSPPDHIVVWCTSDIRGGRGPRCYPPPLGGDGRETDSKRIERGGKRPERQGQVSRLPFTCRRWDAPLSEWSGCHEAPAPPSTWCPRTFAFGRHLSHRPSLQTEPSGSGSNRYCQRGGKKNHSDWSFLIFFVIWTWLRQYCHFQFWIKPSLVKFTIFNSLIC